MDWSLPKFDIYAEEPEEEFMSTLLKHNKVHIDKLSDNPVVNDAILSNVIASKIFYEISADVDP